MSSFLTVNEKNFPEQVLKVSSPVIVEFGAVFPDPAAATGTPAEIALAFKDAYRMLHQRIAVFTALPLRSLDQLSLQTKVREIGRMQGATGKVAEPG